MNQHLADSARHRLEDLLSFFEVNAKVEAEIEDDSVNLSVDTDAGARLIGHRGETLNAIQHVLNMMLRQQTDERVYVHVDIGGYRRSRLEKLEVQAQDAALKAREEQEEVTLPMMSAAERRHIHSFLTDVEGVSSESRGEGNRRRLVVVPDVGGRQSSS